MLKQIYSWLAASALIIPLAVSWPANAAELQIEFEEPEKYTDIEPSEGNRARHRERVLQVFEEIFTGFAERLPEEQVFNVTVTNIDLAGYIEPVPRSGGLERMRIVRPGHEPSIRFTYSLVDSDNNVLQEGDEHLRGRSTTSSIRRAGSPSHDSFRHEREMLERWFRGAFEQR